MKTIRVEPTPEHHAFRDDCIALLKKHSGHLPAIEMLALACHLVGQLMAHQDQRKYTRDDLITLLIDNAEKGNAEVLAELDNTKGSA